MVVNETWFVLTLKKVVCTCMLRCTLSFYTQNVSFLERSLPGTRIHTPRLGRSLSKSVQLAAIYVPSLQSRVCLVLRNRLQCNVTTGGCFKGELNYNRGRCKQRVYNAMPVFETYNKNTIDIN